jgi:hypothetical protein
MVVASATLAVALAGTPVLAQVTTGTVTGVVTDAQGASVPGATAGADQRITRESHRRSNHYRER